MEWLSLVGAAIAAFLAGFKVQGFLMMKRLHAKDEFILDLQHERNKNAVDNKAHGKSDADVVRDSIKS